MFWILKARGVGGDSCSRGVREGRGGGGCLLDNGSERGGRGDGQTFSALRHARSFSLLPEYHCCYEHGCFSWLHFARFVSITGVCVHFFERLGVGAESLRARDFEGVAMQQVWAEPAVQLLTTSVVEG